MFSCASQNKGHNTRPTLTADNVSPCVAGLNCSLDTAEGTRGVHTGEKTETPFQCVMLRLHVVSVVTLRYVTQMTRLSLCLTYCLLVSCLCTTSLALVECCYLYVGT